ncbi:hypothetical protein KI387_037047, partial [Taxus chinensis]
MMDRKDQWVVSIGCSRLGAAISSPKSFFGGGRKSFRCPGHQPPLLQLAVTCTSSSPQDHFQGSLSVSRGYLK